MNLTEGQLFTIEALNKIQDFVWPKDANFACAFNIISGRHFGVEFYIEKPTHSNAIEAFKGALSKGDPTKVIIGQHPDWRNSLITREQFDNVDGWVRNDESMLSSSALIDIKTFNGVVNSKVRCESNFKKYGNAFDIEFWRYHKPTKETEMINPTPYKKRDCIETLIDKRKDAIEQKRLALSALEEAEAKERELMLSIQAWAESYGFDIRVLDESDEVQEHESELVITDWRDLRVWDVVLCNGITMTVDNIVGDILIAFRARSETGGLFAIYHGTWKFISRPSK